jgi:hypothetical protein
MIDNWNHGAVDWKLQVVGTKAMSVCIRVTEEAALQHLVWGNIETRNKVRGRESTLFSLAEVVVGVLVQDETSNGVKRILLLGPHLGDVKDIKW